MPPDQEFDEVHHALRRSRMSGDRLAVAPSEPGPFFGNYRLERLLKRGGESETWLALDLSGQRPVVIKQTAVGAFSRGMRMRLEHEAKILSRIGSELLTPLLDYGANESKVYLVTPFIPGVTLEARLRRRGPLSVTETIAVGRALLGALSQAHRHGVLHRDVKPGNIVVNEDGPLRSARLIDFGLAWSAGLDASIRDEWAGTALYQSPEAAGLLDQDVGECSDLYAAGLVLYECLSGQNPFHGSSLSEVLRKQLTVYPWELRRLGLSVPRALDDLIQRLLRKDPRDRYQSAEAVVLDLTAIAEALQRGEKEAALVVGQRDLRHTITEAAFVGRTEELAGFARQMEEARDGQSRLIFLEAESGGGKSRLLAEFGLKAAQRGLHVLRGQGLDQEAQRPFQLLAGVADDLAATVALEPDLARALSERLGEQREAACAALPPLAAALGVRVEQAPGPEAFGEMRSVQALSLLIEALSGWDRPVLILLDDCQWADQMALKVLTQWWRTRPSSTLEEGGGPSLPTRDSPKRAGVLLVASFRSEEVSHNHPLRKLHPSAHLKLPPFEAAELRQLVESMAGPLPGEAVDVVERLAEGSPFMASAVLRGLVESSVLVPEATGWRLDASGTAEDVHSSRNAAVFLARRIGLLPESSLRLLVAGAVLGKEFDLSAAAKLAGESAEEALAALAEARRRHMVWAKGHGERCAFIHDKLREAFLARLAEGERKGWHLRAALDLEAREPEAVFDLAYHFDAAGEHERALPYALAAAAKARAQYTLHIAEQLYRIADRGARGCDAATRHRVVDALGDVLLLRGRYEEAKQRFGQAVELAEGEVNKARIEGKLGELAFKQGDMRGAIEAYKRALLMLGRKIPKRPRAFLLPLAVEVLIQAFHTVFPRIFLARRSLEGAEAELLAARLDNRLSYAYWFAGGRIPCLWAHLRSMNRLERYPPTPDLAHAYSSHAPGISLIGLFRRGLAYSHKSMAIYDSLGNLWGRAQALNFCGVVLYAASRFEECIESSSEAIRLLMRTGDVWEANLSRYHVGLSRFRLGDLTSAARDLARIHESGVELGDIQASGAVMDIWAQCTGGRLPSGVLEAELARPRSDTQVNAQLLIAKGVRQFWRQREDEAARYFWKAHRNAEEGGIRSPYVRPALPWYASALRRLAAKTSSLTPRRRAELLEEAAWAARRALRVARKFQNELPHALREVGAVAAMQGQERQARRCLDESLAVASRQKARFEHAQTLLMRGRVGRELGWPGAEKDLGNARAALYELDAEFVLDLAEDEALKDGDAREPTLSLVDRFETLLEVGREIAAALDTASILRAAEEVSLRLLRAERCILFQWSPDESRLVPLGAPPDKGFSKEMVQRAFDREETVVFHEMMAESASESLMLSGVRCALCVPFRIQGRVAGCFYLVHRHVGSLFGEEEKRLASFIATIVGVALENAERFKELQSVNRSLASESAKLKRAEAQLKEHVSELARSNQELEQVAYVASHDLRSPLGSIINWTQMLSHLIPEPRTAELEQALAFVQGNAAKAIDLINGVMELARLNISEIDVSRVDLNAVVEDVLESLAREIRDAGAEIQHTALPTVDGNVSHLASVFRNLIQNGLIYRAKSRRLEIRLGFTEREDFYEVFVKDNGVGIEPEQQDKIFQMFARAHSQKDYPAGQGIGLAFCKKVVELYGGRIWVESTPGEGSSFFFTYPKRWTKGQAAREQARKGQAG